MTNKKHTHKTVSEGVSCKECISYATEKSIKDQQELMDKHTPDIVKEIQKEYRENILLPEDIDDLVVESYQQGYKDGEKKAFKYLEEFFETETQFDYDDLIAMKSNIKALKDK